jgi:hypothetical protein
MAVLHLAIYDALALLWEQKQEKSQSAPFEEYREVHRWGNSTDYSSYIYQFSAVAATVHAIIGYYFPDQKEFLDFKLK